MILSENIYNAFGKTYVKNLNRSIDRWESFKNSAERINLIYERIPSIDGRKYITSDHNWFSGLQVNYPGDSIYGFIGGHLTFLYCVLRAMSLNENSFILCDDDVEFIDLKIEDINSKLPDDWDIISLNSFIPPNDTHSDVTFKKLYKKYQYVSNEDFQGFNSCAIHARCYEKLIYYMQKFESTGDNMISNAKDLIVYRISPELTRHNLQFHIHNTY